MAFAWKRANPVGSLNLLRSHRQLLGLATIDFIVNVAHQVLPSVFVLYAAYRYGWDETTVGLTLAFVGVCTALVQGLLVGPAVTLARRAARADRRLAVRLPRHGDLCPGAQRSVVLAGRAGDGAVGRGRPYAQDMMSRRVSPSEQGQLQGANSSSRSIAGLIGPAIFTATFAWLIHWLPGAPFLLAALLLVAAAGGRLDRYSAAASRRPASRELADQPVGLQRIVEPRLGPAAVEAAAHDGGGDILAVEIEQRQLATRLGEPAAQVQDLR